MSCLILGSMKGLTQTQKSQYTEAASTFLRIQDINDTIRIKRQLGNKSLAYYTFANNKEKTTYRLGQFVLSQNDPDGAANGYYDDVLQN
jgi:hypothetical protein